MKYLLLFLFAVFIGTVCMYGILQPWTKVTEKPAGSPQSSSTKSSLSPSQFSLTQSPSKTIKGQIISQSGEVLWQSRVATSAAILTQNIPIQQAEKVVTSESGNIKIELPETAILTIFPNSELEFTQTLPESVVLNQFNGRVDYNKAGPNPISIRSLHLLIKLNEGNFFIVTDKENSRTILTVTKGTAQIAYNNSQAITQVVEIPEGQELTFDDESREIDMQKF